MSESKPIQLNKGGRPRKGELIAAMKPLNIALEAMLRDLGLTVTDVERLADADKRWLKDRRRLLPLPDLMAQVWSHPRLPLNHRVSLHSAYIESQILSGSAPKPRPADKPSGIVAISALNLDQVLPLKPSRKLPAQFLSYSIDVEEVLHSEADYQRHREAALGVARRRGEVLQSFNGGSTVNSMRVIAFSNLVRPIVAVGVQGALPVYLRQHTTHADELRQAGVDVRLIGMTSSKIGRCLSVVRQRGDRVERRMFTLPGANAELPEHLLDNFWEIVQKMLESRAVLLSSYFDNHSAAILAQLLRWVVSARPDLYVVFDPGHTWTSTYDESIFQLFQLSNLVFVNEAELRQAAEQYGRPTVAGTDTDSQLAASVLRIMRKGSGRPCLVAVKHKGSTVLYESGGKRAGDAHNIDDIDPAAVRDDTGAGDAFMAGYLISLLSPGQTNERNAHLALELGRLKLPRVGPPERAEVRRTIQRVLTSFATTRANLDVRPGEIHLARTQHQPDPTR